MVTDIYLSGDSLIKFHDKEHLGVISDTLIKLLIVSCCVIAGMDFLESGFSSGFVIMSIAMLFMLSFFFSALYKVHRNRVYFIVFMALYHLPIKYVSLGQVLSPTLMWFMIIPTITAIFLSSRASWFIFILINIEIGISIFLIKIVDVSTFEFEGLTVLELRTLFGWIVISSALNYIVNYIESSKQKLDNAVRLKQQQGVQSEKFAAMGEMAGAIAHEVNNPLQLIQGQIYRLSRSLEDLDIRDSEINEIMERLSLSTKRLGNIISTMSSVIRFKENEVGKKRVHDSLMMAIAVVERSISNSNIDFLYSPEDFEIEGILNNALLTQAIINILKNSEFFISNLSEKWIKIVIVDRDEDCLIRFIDSGRGVSKENIKKMFNPFYSTKDVNQGLGLGLSIARANVESMNGELGYLEIEGHTCFEVKLQKN